VLYRSKLNEKLNEALEAVLPILGIVLLLSVTAAPVPPGILMAFLVGAVLLVVGLGLPIVRQIAEEHGGSVKIESDGGAVVTVTLPLHHAPESV